MPKSRKKLEKSWRGDCRGCWRCLCLYPPVTRNYLGLHNCKEYYGHGARMNFSYKGRRQINYLMGFIITQNKDDDAGQGILIV